MFFRNRLWLSCWLAGAAFLFGPAAHADLAEVHRAGVLKVAVYKKFAPFSDADGGIDVEFAQALADQLGLKLSLLPFDAGETMSDDFRNMVWKGHYLGYGPADVLMHVPVDKRLMIDNRQVDIFAPYYRETVRLVRDVRKVPEFRDLDSLVGKKIGVEEVSIASIVLLGAENGKFRDNVKIYKTATEALRHLKSGELDAVMATRSQIEAVLGNEAGFQQAQPPLPNLPPQGWVVGLAVKKDNTELAKALQAATNALVASGELARIFAKHGVQLTGP